MGMPLGNVLHHFAIDVRIVDMELHEQHQSLIQSVCLCFSDSVIKYPKPEGYL